MILLDKSIRKSRTYSYFRITIFLYLTIFNGFVLCKGGGKGRGGGDGSDGTATIGNKSNGPYINSKSPSSSRWVFFYYGANGSRSCGNLCVLTSVFVIVTLLSIIGCGIWRCYRIKKRSKADEAERNRFNQNNGFYEHNNNSSYYSNHDEEANHHSRPSPPPPNVYPPPTVPPPISFPTPIYDANPINYTPGYTGNNKVSPSPSRSRRESSDSMDEVRPTKKK